ncbi:hypothetical protein ABFX02_09G052300 [Erythranthe guttata]
MVITTRIRGSNCLAIFNAPKNPYLIRVFGVSFLPTIPQSFNLPRYLRQSFLKFLNFNWISSAHMAPPQGRKKSQGRRKIEMKLISDENARTVTFSKRRAGLFKKATELSVLCGTQIALIIFSLGGRAYSFGNPSVGSVLDRFRSKNRNPNVQDSVHATRIRSATLQQLKEQCDQKNKELEIRKTRGKEIEATLEGSSCQISEERLNLLDFDQLKQLKEKMENLRDNLRRGLANRPRSGSIKHSRSRLDFVGSSAPKKVRPTNIEANGPQVGFVKPASLIFDVAGPSDPKKATLANIQTNGPKKGFNNQSHLRLDVAGPSDPNKVDVPNVEQNMPCVGFVKPSYLRRDVVGLPIPKKVNLTNVETNGSHVGFVKPLDLTLNVGGPLASEKADSTNTDANGPRVGFVKPLHLRLSDAGPSGSKKVDLANVDREECGASSIPSDWLKL